MTSPPKKPLTIPQKLEEKDGVEWLTFVYTTKGNSESYTIRIDVDSVQNDFDLKFKTENSVYPRAICSREEYKGNRWDYETTVNDIGWKLCWLNPILSGSKRGLLQRAVDSYRNRFPELQSRRVARVGKSAQPKKSVTKKEYSPKNTKNSSSKRSQVDNEIALQSTSTKKRKFEEARYILVDTVKDSKPFQLKVRVDIENASDLGTDIKKEHMVFPVEHNSREEKCNKLAWQLASLNPELLDSPSILQRALDVYLVNFEPREMWPPRRQRLDVH